jgi:hypothetical protein
MKAESEIENYRVSFHVNMPSDFSLVIGRFHRYGVGSDDFRALVVKEILKSLGRTSIDANWIQKGDLQILGTPFWTFEFTRIHPAMDQNWPLSNAPIRVGQTLLQGSGWTSSEPGTARFIRVHSKLKRNT